MTERLAALLHEEAAALDIPPVDHAAILRRGRHASGRRRATAFLAAAAVVVAGGTGAALALTGSDSPDRDGRATDSVAGEGPAHGVVAYGADSTVVVDGASATIPDTLHSLHYTSVGVLTRSNPNDGASSGSGPETLTLVATDGTTTDLGTIPEGVGPATDPDEPVYALAEKSGNGFRAVVRDALTGDEVGSVPLPDLPRSYWSVPPLALDGDVVYAGFENEAVAFDWRTGEEQPTEGLDGGIPDVRGGLALASGEKLVDGRLEMVVSVVDAATGASALVVPLEDGEYGFGSLSPDGRFLRFTSETDPDPKGDFVEPTGVDVYDVDTGDRVTLEGDPYSWGWTSAGSALLVSGAKVQVCDPATGSCESETGPDVGRNLKVGGRTYES
ncbi:hypothetical protein [Nocardioides piscis]|uniref:WD40 repeat domain-containing protein n=1 Tax=Nocardioides piscis TaxID=2714938 RepID=A0A6G7YJY8_9ACTN|nr:hypothetical protein [Nocardioides piscis]QIK77063.1 hypothetical protein G7071_18100 [Nocardioides piscis]